VAKGEALLREAPVDGALVIGRAAKGLSFKATGKAGPFTRVEIEPNRFAFVNTAEVHGGGSVQGSFKPEWHVTPPVLTVVAPPWSAATWCTSRAPVTDDHEVKDVYVRVWNRDSKMPPKKVFYLPNRGDKNKLAFEADVPLWPGSNLVPGVRPRDQRDPERADGGGAGEGAGRQLRPATPDARGRDQVARGARLPASPAQTRGEVMSRWVALRLL
jgi:hypothetical protein